uniref:Uncharacterized protein n=1 Tax=Arundo donax TaxID=35708 RepID=A0A0A8ZUU6_ARUDO
MAGKYTGCTPLKFITLYED